LAFIFIAIAVKAMVHGFAVVLLDAGDRRQVVDKAGSKEDFARAPLQAIRTEKQEIVVTSLDGDDL
jgi:hypothetical protein